MPLRLDKETFIFSIRFPLLKGAVKTVLEALSEDVNLPMMLGPNITGYSDYASDLGSTIGSRSNGFCGGAFGLTSAFKGDTIARGNNYDNLYRSNFNASRCSSIYGASTTVQPSSLNLNALIKY